MIPTKLNKTVCSSIAALLIMYAMSPFFLSIVEAVQESEIIELPNSKPYGLSYGEWSAKWWQWALSIPENENPIKDKSGNYCATNQINPNAWFLAGSGGGQVTRTCTIPAEKSIFFPIMDVECSYAEYPTAKTENDLRNCAHEDQNTVTSLKLLIDGHDIQNLTKYRADSPLFNFTTPENGLFGLKSAKTQAVSDGYFIMLKPLSAGSHEIIYSGILGEPTIAGSQLAPEKVTYHLTIE